MREVTRVFNTWLEFESEEERKKRLNLPHFDNPNTDNERLSNYQYDYIMHGDRKAEGLLWLEFEKICRRWIKRESKLNNIFMNSDDIEIKGGIACDYVMRRYKEHLKLYNSYYIIKDFVSAAHDAMIHAVYHPEENDFILDKVKTMNEKPIEALKEIDLSIIKKAMEEEAERELKKKRKAEGLDENGDLPGQLYLFAE